MTARHDHSTARPRLGRYEIDTAASSLTFVTRHVFGLLPVRGSFSIGAGTVDVAEPPDDSRVHVEIETASFHTGNGARDASVLSPRFLDAARHPLITFDSARLDGTALTGTLTACGMSRPVTLEIERSDVAPDVLTARATARVDRTAFGVTASRGMAGRHLDLTLDIRCARS
ncbi:YceI family protein [Streptomyces sp. SBT349]|uniref:YceI family protein n=1 Tax=Streptomyces sp. SBT349 TaxID=1580539 RepID=UPI00066DBEA2|nr:YceI family protein [Streptomyces sp. SBT349]